MIRGLVKAGAIEAVAVDADRPFACPDPDYAPPALEPAQREAAASLAERAIGKGLRAVPARRRHRLGQDRSLFRGDRRVPPAGAAGAGPAPRDRADRALPASASPPASAAIPSPGIRACAQSQRRRAWRAIASGEAKVVVGARSALFLPYPKLGLIVVDEAHEPSFKQEDGVQYHARDVAVMRAKFEDIPVILASATPAIESRHMVEIGRYREVSLPERYGGASLPDIRAIDLTQDPPPRGRWLAPAAGQRARGESRARASSRCCSSTAAATRRSPCAAIAATASNARTAPPGWSSTGSCTASPATIAAT